MYDIPYYPGAGPEIFLGGWLLVLNYIKHDGRLAGNVTPSIVPSGGGWLATPWIIPCYLKVTTTMVLVLV